MSIQQDLEKMKRVDSKLIQVIRILQKMRNGTDTGNILNMIFCLRDEALLVYALENIEPYLYIFWAQDKPKMIRNMLEALAIGQDEMINAVKPSKLKKMIEPYRNRANSNPASGTLF